METIEVTRHYTPEGLIGKQVLAVVNFPQKQIGAVVLCVPDHEVPLGTKLL